MHNDLLITLTHDNIEWVVSTSSHLATELSSGKEDVLVEDGLRPVKAERKRNDFYVGAIGRIVMFAVENHNVENVRVNDERL
mgnify:CR=1 FL=1